MKSGDLRHPIVLQRPVRTVNEKGRPVTVWEEIAAVHAAVSDVSGREFYAAHAVQAEDVVTFTIRWRDDVDASCRLVRQGAAYNILEVNHLGYMRDYIRLRCRLVTGEG